MTVLVLAEHDGSTLKPATLSTITAAAQLGDVTVLVIGDGCQQAARVASTVTGVSAVRVADDGLYTDPLAESFSPLIVREAADFDAVLAPATTFGKNILPRVAAVLDVQAISDVVGIVSADTFTHPIYAGNALITVQTSDALKVLTIRPTAFDAADFGANAPITAIEVAAAPTHTTFVSRTLTPSDRVELTAAKTIVTGGRALGSADNFDLLKALADKLDGAVGATRAAVDAGFAPNDWQIGQTGKVVAPELYIALGVSGAIQHLAGMKDSRIIVAINTDPEAPIFKVADYGIQGDLFEVLPQLLDALDKS